MSILRFFSSYLPRQDKSISTTLSIYKIQINTENTDILNLIHESPHVDNGIFSQKRITMSSIIEYLGLKIEFHNNIIEKIIDLLGKNAFKADDMVMVSVITMRSSCCLLFYTIDRISSPILMKYMVAIKSVAQFIISEPYFGDFFQQIFEKFVSFDDSYDIFDFIKCFQIVTDQYPSLVYSCSQAHISICLRIINVFVSGKSQIDSKIISKQFFLASSAFDSLESIEKADFLKLVKPIIAMINYLAINWNGIRINCAVLSLMISVRRHVSFDISPFMDVLRIMCKRSDIFNQIDQNYDNSFYSPPDISFSFDFSSIHPELSPEFNKNPERIPSILELEISETYTLISSSKLIGKQLAISEFDSFAQIYSLLLKEMSEGDLNFLAIFIIIVSQLSKYSLQIGELLANTGAFDLLFPDSLFRPTINIFYNPKNVIINLRTHLFATCQRFLLNDKINISFRQSYLRLMKRIVGHPLLFSDVICTSYQYLRKIYEIPMINDELGKVVFESLEIHSNLKDPKIYESTLMLMSFIKNVFSSQQMLLSIAFSPYSSDSLIHFLSDPQYSRLFIDIYYQLCLYISMFEPDPHLNNFVISTHKLLSLLNKSLDDQHSLDLSISIISIYNQILSLNPSHDSGFIVNTVLLNDIISFLLNLPGNKSSLSSFKLGVLLLCKFMNHPEFSFSFVPFNSLSLVLRRIGSDMELYEMIWNMTVYSKADYYQIYVSEAIPLLLSSSIDVSMYHSVLKSFVAMCSSSYYNRCAILHGISSFPFESHDQEESQVIIELYLSIFRSACNLKSMNHFLRLFSRQKEVETDHWFESQISQIESLITNSADSSHFSMVMLPCKNSRIVLPGISFRELQDEWLFSMKVLFDSTIIGRYLFYFSNDESWFYSTFINEKLVFNFKLGNETKICEIGFIPPSQNWFSISVLCKKLETFHFYLNDKYHSTIKFSSSNQMNSDFTKASILETIEDSFSCSALLHSSSLYIRSSIWGFSMPQTGLFNLNNDIYDIKNIRSNMTNIYQIDNDVIHQKFIKTNIRYSGVLYQFYSNFLKVFETSRSLSVIVSMFALFETYSSDNKLVLKVLVSILNAITSLIKKSPECCNQLHSSHAYSILSYFLMRSSSLLHIEDIWDLLIAQFNQCKNPQLRDDIGKWTVFRIDLISKFEIKLQIKAFTDWLSILKDYPHVFSTYIRFSLVILLFLGYVPTQENLIKFHSNSFSDSTELAPSMTKICGILYEIGLIISTNQIEEKEADVLIKAIINCHESEQTLQLLSLLHSIINSSWFKNDSNHFRFSISWVSLFSHSDDQIRVKWLSMFYDLDVLNEDIVTFAQHLITLRPVLDNECSNSENSLLVNCCRNSLQISEIVTLEDLIMMNTLVLQKPIYFYLSISCAIASTDRMSFLFSEYLKKLLQLEKNISIIADTISSFSMFLVVFWSLYRHQASCKQIACIASRSPKLLRAIIDIIDDISIQSHTNNQEYRSSFLKHVLINIDNRSVTPECIQFAEIIALGIIFRSSVYSSNLLWNSYHDSVYYCKNGDHFSQYDNELPDLISLSALYASNIQSNISQVFSLYFDDKGKWAEHNFAIEIIEYLLKIETSYPLSVYQLLIILSIQFYFYSDNESDLSTVLHAIVYVIEKCDCNDEFLFILSKIVCRIPKHPHYHSIYQLLNKKINIESTKQNGFHVLNNYCEQPPATMNSIHGIISLVYSSILDRIPKLISPLTNDSSHSIAQKTKVFHNLFSDLVSVSGRHWISLCDELKHERSPFLSISSSIDNLHYKCFAMKDRLLRPSLLKRNPMFDMHQDASSRRDSIASLERDRSNSFRQSQKLSSMPSKKQIIEEPSIIMSMKFIWRSRCEYIKVNKKVDGIFIIHPEGYLFASVDGSVLQISSISVDKILCQYYLHRPSAIEIFTFDHISYFFNFPEMESHKFVSYFKVVPLPRDSFVQNLQPQNEIEKYTKRWISYEISTFEYLMWLNQFSGRSMNNVCSYPVFPWVLKDYNSSVLKIDNPDCYRDLSKPIGALGQVRLDKLKNLMENSLENEKFLYHSMYSCSFFVFHYLVRMEPFTTLHIKHQDGKFDVPMRIFSSISSSFKSVCENNNNFRELIPEFFYNPEFLRNNNSFDLGVCSDGSKLGDIILPPWASSPEEFIYVHKLALESDYVSRNISLWIDLIWGYKQSGSPAIESDNTYDPRLYSDVWNKYSNEGSKLEIESLLSHVGSIPIRLFDAPHPTRNIRPLSPPILFKAGISDTPIVCIKIVGDSYDKLSAFVLSIDGRIYISRSNMTTSIVSKEKIDSIVSYVPGNKESGHFAFLQTNSTDLYVVRTNGTINRSKSKHHMDQIRCAAFMENKIITGGEDSVLVEWRLNEKGDYESSNTIISHTDGISCCAYSQAFGVVLSCSVDGLLIISFSSSFAFIRSLIVPIHDGHIPIAIFVTEGMGFIIVNSSHPQVVVDGSEIFIYSLNGRFIKSSRFGVRVTCICPATDSNDIDYLLLTQEGSVYLYDAFYLTKQKEIFSLPCRITSLAYQRSTDILYVGDEKGTIYWMNLFSKHE